MQRKRMKKIVIILIITLGLLFTLPNLILKNTRSEKILQSKIRQKYLDNEDYTFIDLIQYATSDVDDINISTQKEYDYCIEDEKYVVDIEINNDGKDVDTYQLEWGIGDDIQEKTLNVNSVEKVQFEFEKEGKNQCKIILKKNNVIIEEWQKDVYYIKEYQKQFGEKLSNQYICVHFIDNLWADIDRLDLLNAIGIKGVRADIVLTIIYANNGEKYDRFDSWINKILDSGLEIQAILNTNPNSVSNLFGEDGKISNDTELQSIINMSEKIANRYPQITEFEILNEPNSYYKTDEDMVWYGKMVYGISKRLKEVNSHIHTIYGSTSLGTDAISSRDFLKQIAENSAYDEASEFSTHIYDFSIDGTNNIMKNNLYNHKEILRKLGGFQSIDITEFGIPEKEGVATEEQQADSIIQQICIQNSYNVKNISYYSFRDLKTGSNVNADVSGVVRDDYTPKLIYYALKNYYENTNGSEYIGTVNLKEGLEAHVYNKDGKPKIIVWSNNSDNTIQIDYTGFTAKDIYGKEISNTDGNLNITTSPVYLDNISTNYFYQAISNVSVEKYQEFTEKYQEQLQNVPELINKIDNLEATMENIKNLDIISEEQAKQLMEEHFKLGNQLIESYQTKKIDVEYVKLSSMLDMLNEIGNSYEDLITVSAVKRTSDLTDTKKLIDEVEELINDNNDLEIIYPSKILEFSKDLYEKVEYINSLEEENDIKTGLIVSKDLHAKYLAEWAKQFTNIYIEEYIKNNPITITYSTQELTNKDVIATLNIGTDCTMTNNDNKNVYTFNQNGEFEFEYVRRGRNFKEKAIVSNIDKTNPKIIGLESEQVYSSAVVFKVEDENFDKVEILINDSLLENYEIGQELKEEGKYHIKAIDKAGNTSEVVFYIMKDAENAYQIEGNKICNIVSNTKTENISQNLPIKEQYVIKRNDRQLEANEVVATGDVIELESGKKYTLIVKGDVNSDGAVNITDLVRTQNFILGRRTATEIEESAADANFDKEQITIKDLVRIQIMILNPPTT